MFDLTQKEMLDCGAVFWLHEDVIIHPNGARGRVILKYGADGSRGWSIHVRLSAMNPWYLFVDECKNKQMLKSYGEPPFFAYKNGSLWGSKEEALDALQNWWEKKGKSLNENNKNLS